VASKASGDDEAKTAKAEAGAFLKEVLADGPQPAKEMIEHGTALGFIKRCNPHASTRHQAGGDRTKSGWEWMLPQDTLFRRVSWPLGILGAFMVDTAKLNLSWHDHRTDLPNWLVEGIGQIAVEWSVIERELEELIRLLMDADIQQTRILANPLNARTRTTVAENLIQALILADRLDTSHLKQFVKIAKIVDPSLQSRRDLFIHGVWDEYKGRWCVLRTRQHRDTPELAPHLEKLRRAVLPQREIIDQNTLPELARKISVLSGSDNNLRRQDCVCASSVKERTTDIQPPKAHLSKAHQLVAQRTLSE
jgi:hypothetical protein